jgi:hypothetical protein
MSGRTRDVDVDLEQSHPDPPQANRRHLSPNLSSGL